MSVTTVRPTSGTFSGGTGSRADTADDSDSTKIQNTSPNLGVISFGFGNASLPAGERPKQATLRGRFNTFGGSWDSVGLVVGDDAQVLHNIGIAPGGWYAASVCTMPLSSDYDGTGNALLASFRGSGNGEVAISELYIDILTVKQPIVAVTAPTGTLAHNRPTITWTATIDGHGAEAVQARYEVKIFNDSVYGAAGFDPNTSTPDAESGVVESGDLSWAESAVFLANDNYQAWVRIAQDINGEPYWSEWESSSFVVSAALPAAPTLAVVADDANGRIGINVTNPGGGAATAQEIKLERSKDGGTTWEGVRTAVDGNIIEPASFALTNTSSGPNATGTGSDGGSGNGGTVAWGTPNSLGSSNNVYATATGGGGGSLSHPLIGVGYGFAIPSNATILGIELVMEAKTSATVQAIDNLYLTKDGGASSAGVNRGGFNLTTSDVNYTRGGSTDLWGSDWTPADINNSLFGFAMSTNLGSGKTVSIDFVSIKVYYQVPGEGNFTANPDVYDYETGNGETVKYRARSRHIASDGELTVSDWVVSSNVEWDSDNYWLKHPNDPSLNMTVDELTSYPGKTTASRSGSFQPLGAARPIIVHDTRGGPTGTIRIKFSTDEEKDAFDALLASGSALLLQLRPGDGEPDRYIVIGDNTRTRYVDNADFPSTQDEFAWTEVDAPPGVLLG